MRRVLIVDDNDAIRESLTDALQDEGYLVDAVSNGLDALAVARERVPTVVLLDLMMPGLSGTDVAQQLKAEGCPASVVMLSADRQIGERSKGAGVAAYLPKPFDLDDLLALLARLAP
jgi:DNA-binding response OmpR family regulator